MEEEEKITAHTVAFVASEKTQPKPRNMHRKHEQIWPGYLTKISAVKHHINLIPGPPPVQSVSYLTCTSTSIGILSHWTKTREIEEFEVRKKPDRGVIEPSNLKWSVRMIFAHKTDGILRFRIHYWKINTMLVKD